MFSLVVEEAEPALFWARQVYVPLWLWLTEPIIKILALVPRLLVIIPESELIFKPWNVHRNDNGSSPAETVHTIMADDPSSNVSLPKLIGTSSGGSEINWACEPIYNIYLSPYWIYTYLLVEHPSSIELISWLEKSWKFPVNIISTSQA